MANIPLIFKVKKFANFAVQIICELENGRLYVIKPTELYNWLNLHGKLNLQQPEASANAPTKVVTGTCTMAEYWEHQKDFHLSDLSEFLQNKYGGNIKYKLRAECLHDAEQLRSMAKIVNFEYSALPGAVIHKSEPDLEVTFESPLDLPHLIDLIKKIDDSHVMYQTVSVIDTYTGIRNYLL